MKNSIDNKTNNIESRGQTKNLSKKRYLSGLYSSSNNLKTVYV